MASNYPHLFSPLRVGNFVVPNRVVMAPTDTSSANADGSVNQRIITYHEEIAKGGCGFVIVGATTPDRFSGRPTVTCLSADEDPMIPGLSELAEAIHRHGACCAVQIQHPGRQAAWPRKNLISATDQVVDLPGSAGHEVIYAEGEAHGKSIRAMTVEEVYALIDQYTEAAWRVQQAGFDSVEIHAAHGYLPAQFMSAFINRRNDRFGGSFLNRMRFILEIVAGIQHKCGRHYPIGIRYSGEEYVPNGRTLDESVKVAKLLEERGLAYLDISAGIFDVPATVEDTMQYPQGWNTYTAEEIKKHVKIPVITSHTLRDPGYCDSVIARGQADLVGLSRQLIADPYWANKAFTGHPEEIRKCISCLVGCWQESLMARRNMRCAINPAVGDERLINMVPAQKKLTVAVVGGGPGGMEAARIATLRGHAVTIFEKTDEIGGAILRCCAVPGKNKMRWYADWLRHQVKKLGVTVRLSTSPTAADLAGFDAVVVATGSQTSRPAIPGINSSLVVPYENVLRCTRPACQYYPKGRGGPVAVGAKVLVWGDHFAAADTAEALALAGKEVCIVTAAREFAQWMEPCHREVMFKIFGGQPVEGLKTKPVAHPVKVFTRTTVTEIAADGTVTLLDAEFHKTTVKVDNVVLAAVEPAPSPYNELIAAGKVAECIGDLKEVRNLRAAVREGANIGLTLDEACRLNANRRMISALPTEVDLEARVVPAVAEVEMEEITVKD